MQAGVAPWQPGLPLQVARRRATMLASARRFFHAHDILEVETPSLSRAAVSDPNIESVGATLAVHPKHEYFLHTSPEFAMKRLLCAGWPDIVQICRVYRDGEIGRHHQPEFTMAEWYRLGISLRDMMDHTLDFLGELLDPGLLADRATIVSYTDVFQQHLGLHPLDADISDLVAAAGADESLRTALGRDRDAWLDLLLSERIAPAFADDRLTVMHHYPASQASLARLCPADVRYADRFEIFFGSLELANGYYELADAGEQARRFAADQDARQRQGLRTRPLDERFLAAMQSGLPPCCGVAVGLDRLLMLNAGTDDLRNVMAFSCTE